MKKIIVSYTFILFIIALVPLFDLLNSGIPTGHDTPDHVARIANFYQSLSEGNIVPRWAGNLNWGYGHPILMFLYPLPSYAASVFHLVGFSFIDSTKLVFGFFYVLSILLFYAWAAKQWGRVPGFIGAILYGFAPYRFVDLYVRGAIGEHVAFAFLPLIFLSMLQIAKCFHSGSPGIFSSQYKKISGWGVLMSLGIGSLLLSHNAITLMFIPIMMWYVGYLWITEVNKSLHFLIICGWFTGLGFLVSAFFWIPAFLEGKYTLRDIVTQGEFSERFVQWQSFIRSGWNYGGGNVFSKEVGILQWVGVIVSVYFLKIRDQKKRIYISSTLVILVITLFLMTSVSQPIWQNITILQKFQFPWRFLSMVAFLTACLGAISVSILRKETQKWIVLFVVIYTFISSYPLWKANTYLSRPDSYYSGIYNSTTDTGESSPIWSVRFMEHSPTVTSQVIEGAATISQHQRTSTRHVYSITAPAKARILENTLYFPGWFVEIDGRRLDPNTEVLYQDPAYRGLITYWIEPGDHVVSILFIDTKLRKIANILSIIGLLMLIGTATILKRRI